MQFAQLRGVSREVIREAFAMHGHQLGLSDTVNLANAKASDYTHAKGLLVPRLDRFQGVLNGEYLKMFDPTGMGPKAGYSFAYCSPVPEDEDAANAERESKAKTFDIYVKAGMDPQMAAELAGLPSVLMSRTPTEAQSEPAPEPEPEPMNNGRKGSFFFMAPHDERSAR